MFMKQTARPITWLMWAGHMILSPVKVLFALMHTTFCSLVGLVTLAIDPSRGDWMMWNVGKRLWSMPLIRRIVGASLSVEIHPDTKRLAQQGKGCVLVANHTSLLDINAAFAASPLPIVFLSKASVRKVPLLGVLNERAGTVFVERGNRASSERAVAALTRTVQSGRSVLVFPEGTRSKDGQLKPFKKGAFHLAQGANCPIVPMHISGTFDILPAGTFLFRPPMNGIRVSIGAPLPTQDDVSTEKWMNQAFQAVLELGPSSSQG
jgi:1-acyl-sn-glycerol-3-phosphate acyltransferase